MNNRILLENTAAISAELHADEKQYQRFYHKHADDLGGFPGIWNFCVDAAKIFSSCESKKEFEWIDAIVTYTNSILDAESLLHKDLKLMAQKAIKAHSY